MFFEYRAGQQIPVYCVSVFDTRFNLNASRHVEKTYSTSNYW